MRLSVSVIALFMIVSPVFPVHAQEPALTWEECVREAAKNHPDLVAASETVRQNEAQKKITASGEYPQVDASARAAASKNAGQESQESYSAGVSGSQLIFDGKKTVNSVKAAQENIQAARQAYRFTSAEVRQRLRAAFVNLLKAQEMTRIAREIFDIRRQNLELITLRYQSGLEHKGALLTAEASLAEARYTVTTSGRDLEVAQRGLSKELGAGQWEPLSVKGDFSVGDNGQGQVDIAALADSNPQVKKLIAQKNAAEFNLKATYGNYAPTVSVDGSVSDAGPKFSNTSGQASAGVTVTMPIFEGGLRKAQVEQGQASVKQLEANLRSTRDGVIVSLEQARASLMEALDNVDVQKKALYAAEERSRIAQAQYSIGTVSFDSWTIIEDNLVSAKRSYLNAEANALLAEANWIQAKGETLVYEK